jgi:uroporphyrin-III C-methyltransferase
LNQAQVILIDDLVNPQLLDHCSATARIKQVGKRGGCISTSQAFIQRLMIHEARKGLKVVRLKGGDATIFARAGEEIEALQAAGIPVEIINGVSSAQAAAAAVSCSLTHREYGQGVVFVTAHTQASTVTPPWMQLAQSGMTLAFFMGVSKVTEIETNLIAFGLSPKTPIAVVENVSLPEQRIFHGNIDELTRLVNANQIKSPAQILVGQALRSALSSSITQHRETESAGRPLALQSRF